MSRQRPDIEEVYNAYIDGASTEELGERYGYTAKSVQSWLRGMPGYPRRGEIKARRPKYKVTDRHRENWLAAKKAGMTLEQIAKKAGVAISTVHYSICCLPGYETAKFRGPAGWRWRTNNRGRRVYEKQ